MKPCHILMPLCLAAAGAAYVVEEVYAYVFLRRSSALVGHFLDKRGHEQAYYTARDTAAAAMREREQEHWSIRSDRGEPLLGYYFPCGRGHNRVAFLVHGYRSEHADTAGRFYDFYAQRGFDLFCCDNTAHGASGGSFVGFSVLETPDCLKWLDTLIARLGPDVEIVLHGFSMGAATVLAMSDRLPPQVKFVIEDSGFASAERQLRGELGPVWPVMLRLHRIVAGCDLLDGDTRPHLLRADVPILFVHGEEDRTVPYENGPALYAAYQGEKACLFVPGAKHIETLYIDPAAYGDAVDSFIAKYM